MKIFLLSQDKNDYYDTYDSCIVIAENEEEAKKIHPGGTYNYPEGEKSPCNNDPPEYQNADKDYGEWVKKEFVKIEYIGEAKEGSEKGVVCASFNAG